jgi:hypothetical protein
LARKQGPGRRVRFKPDKEPQRQPVKEPSAPKRKEREKVPA